ncbi:histone [Actinacidiphila glaucinigra]|uniref:histone n=1 Tax=Actinacidiphila glaucinigra TaxID=235986 RepID=UPI00369CBBE5
MRDALRTCLQIAGGLTEATRRRAVGAAKELLDQTGIDVDAVQRSIGERIPPEVQTLADELMASGRANRDLLVGLIREEIDKAMSRVGRLADEVTKVGVVLEALERRIRNLEDDDREPAWADVTDDEPDPGMYVPPQPPVEHAPVDGQAPASAPGRKPARKPEPTGAAGVTPVARKNAAPAHPPTASEASEASEAPAAQEPVGTAGAGAVPVARKNAAPAKAPARKKAAPAARKTAPAKKAAPARTAAPAKKAAPAARKTAAATPAKKTAPAAKKATPATAPAKKTAAASRTSAPAPAKKTAATKSTAKTAAPARKAAPAKKTAARSQEAKGRD